MLKFGMTRRVRLAYALVALSGSVTMYGLTSITVHAAQIADVSNYNIQQEIDSRKDKETAIDQHLAASDVVEAKDVAELKQRLDRQGESLASISDKVSTITGVGGTILALLGILNLLGFINPIRPGKKEVVL